MPFLHGFLKLVERDPRIFKLRMVILFTYHHDSHGLQESLTDLQHEFRQIANWTTHIHLDESSCLEIVSVRGKVKRIQALARGIMNRRGVMQLKLSTVAV